MKTKILIVDDTKSIRNEICDILKMEGFDPICASNVDEGILKVMNENPDLIITDIRMPVKSGFDFIKTLNADVKFKNIPLLVLSAYADAKNIGKALDLGVLYYLTKPCSADTLIDTINSALIWKN